MHGIQLIRALTPNLKDTWAETERESAAERLLAVERIDHRSEAFRREYEGQFFDSEPFDVPSGHPIGTFSNRLSPDWSPRDSLKKALDDLRNAPLRVRPYPLPVVPLWLLKNLSD